jgi:hypothetical protein
MGEYAKVKGTGVEVKIGTCESMYYLRADQADEVRAIGGNVDPVKDRFEIRFRFPFPDEDTIAPGGFEHYNRGFRIGLELHGEREHGTVQVSHGNGYLLNLPCPEGFASSGNSGRRTVATKLDGSPLEVMLNGYGGAAELVQQKWVQGVGLVGIVRCKGCGHLWRMTREEAEDVARQLEADAQREQVEYARWARRDGKAEREIGTCYQATYNREVAARLVGGYVAWLKDHGAEVADDPDYDELAAALAEVRYRGAA